LLRGKRANAERCSSLRIEDSPQLAVEIFNSTVHLTSIQSRTRLLYYPRVLEYSPLCLPENPNRVNQQRWKPILVCFLVCPHISLAPPGT
jgi:hypothetical protein